MWIPWLVCHRMVGRPDPAFNVIGDPILAAVIEEDKDKDYTW